MDKKEDNKDKKEVREPAATYQTKAAMLAREIPDYVLEDIRIGIEQYRQGECKPVSEFLAKYGRKL